LDQIKDTFRILSTNWIHLLGFYVTTHLTVVLFQITKSAYATDDGWIEMLSLSFLSVPLVFFTYGLVFLIGFYGVILVLDSIGFSLDKLKIRQVLILEWVIISLPFIIWAFEYEYWLWISLSISFLITQLIREKRIKRILNINATQKK
jgi:hypothetical protein